MEGGENTEQGPDFYCKNKHMICVRAEVIMNTNQNPLGMLITYYWARKFFALDDVPTPSQTPRSSLSLTVSQRLEAIEAAERDIEKEMQEIVKEKQKIWQFWRNTKTQPLSRYLLTLPPLNSSLLLVLLCCAIKIIFCLYILSMLLHSYDSPLMYLLCFIVIHIGSTFATVELLIMRTKKVLWLCALVDATVILIVLVLLAIISTTKEGEGIVPVERVAGVSIVIGFLELLCLVHYYHIQYTIPAAKKSIKKVRREVELPCTCRIEQSEDVNSSTKRSTRSRRSQKSRKRSRSSRRRHSVESERPTRYEACYCSCERERRVREIPIRKVSHEGPHEYREVPRGYTRCEYSCSCSSPPMRYVRNPYTGEIRRLSHSSL